MWPYHRHFGYNSRSDPIYRCFICPFIVAYQTLWSNGWRMQDQSYHSCNHLCGNLKFKCMFGAANYQLFLCITIRISLWILSTMKFSGRCSNAQMNNQFSSFILFLKSSLWKFATNLLHCPSITASWIAEGSLILLRENITRIWTIISKACFFIQNFHFWIFETDFSRFIFCKREIRC